MNKEAIEEMIRYENEGIYIDFKAIEYTKDKYPNLLKDIMSMANAHYSHDKFIIIGVKHKSDNTRDFLGIKALTDSASIQQLVNENIEPDLNISYDSITIDNKLLGVLKISDCSNRPYMMKKDYKTLKKGEGYIRKGSFQMLLSRPDYDQIYAFKQENLDLKDKIIIKNIDEYKDEIILKVINKNFKFPSKIEEKKIQNTLLEKKEQEKYFRKLGINNPSQYVLSLKRAQAYISGSFIEYEDRTIKELEDALQNISEQYYNLDYTALFNKSNIFNLIITNVGNKYIEDSSIQIIIPKVEGLLVFDHDPNKDENKPPYPQVNTTESSYSIEYRIGDIKHGLDTKAFKENVRIAISDNCTCSEFEIECKIYAKNIKDFFSQKIKVFVDKQ